MPIGTGPARRRRLNLAAVLFLLAARTVHAESSRPVPRLTFEANQGQFSRDLTFVARAPGFSVGVSPGRGGLVFRAASGEETVLRLWRSASAVRVPRGEKRAVGEVNYFLGRDLRRWRAHVPTFEQVRWPGVYDGVDLIVRGNPTQLEVDFEVAPGASADVIEWEVARGGSLKLDLAGKLSLDAPGLHLRIDAPRTWERNTVASGWASGPRVETRGARC